MSLPTGRGSRQVRSCGLLSKRHGVGKAVKVKYAEREISASFIDVLLHRDSRRESHRNDKFAPA
jgi:hypothetical protein